ncbi:hypothetical protein AYK24_08300 [Thermoplasmatales archaeon SG8-52-4]|nr:MAG: hypothetical protein AYK24_08300 [Thermoplasmatales archaeon SG8-52-4]
MKKYFLRRRKLIKLIILVGAFLISLSLISVNIPSMTITKKIDNENIYVNIENEISTGLAPIKEIDQKKEINDFFVSKKSSIDSSGRVMYGYVTYPPPEKLIYFDLDDPENSGELGDSISDDFLAGGTFGCDGIWYGVEYGSGILYGIDPYSGDMWSIGGGGIGMHGLAYDPITHKMYGSSDNDYLYEIYPDTGEQEQIGPFGGSVQYMIGMAFDSDGILYGWDLGSDSLWTIDTETGEATQVGSLGISINYAQDGDFHRESDKLYLTAYTTTGQLYECDKYTGECTLLGTLPDGMEITASIFLNECIPPDHDIALLSIDKPESGMAISNIPMQVTIKNRGNNTETTDVQMQVLKFEEDIIIFEENFSDEYLPDGWETDYWTISETNNAGGKIPEAQCYNMNQYSEGQYYDNYIMSSKIDCTGLEKIQIKFRWAAEYSYPQYASMYVKVRNNSTSNWKDVTPWENPIGNNQDCDLYEICYYSLDEPLGEEFQIKWEYIGYYYYYTYLWLDEIKIIEFNTTEEYNEIIEDLEIEKNEEINVDFPTWTPADWENTYNDNITQDYVVYAKSLLEDDVPKNDYKNKIIKLYFPLDHDVEIKNIDSPFKDGPGKTYPVKTTIKNVGKNTECCLSIDVKIAESTICETVFSEYDWPGSTHHPGQTSGWTDEHDSIAYNYGWQISYGSSYAGGSPFEAYLPYYHARQYYHFYSHSINTTEYQKYKLYFKSYINHYSGQDKYSLVAGYSTNLETWNSVWHVEPSSNDQYDVSVTIEGGSETTYIGFWVIGNPYYFNYWYIDDIELKALNLSDEEYSDFVYYDSEIEPGDEITFTFDDWIPDYLQYETTAIKNYLISAEINLDGDLNNDNNYEIEEFNLYYWHDVRINELTSPSGYSGIDPYYWVHYDKEYFDDSFGLQDGGTFEYAIRLTPDELNNYTGGYIFSVKRYHGEYATYEMSGKMKIYGQGTSNQPGELLSETHFQGTLNDWHEVKLNKPIKINGNKDLWISVECTHKAGQKPALGDYDGPEYGKSDWLYINDNWIEAYTLGFYHDWMLQAGCLVYGSPYVYIQPGTETIQVLVENNGTFPELDLACSTKIYEHITNCSNGTQVYEDIIEDIDLDDPLGETELLTFDDFTFADEGPYNLFINIPDENDDLKFNNMEMMGIRVDDTPPMIYYSIFPEEPDGKNGWYITGPTISFYAIDPEIGCGLPGSGVKEIRYSINGGAQQVIPGGAGSFVLSEDGNDILIEFWPVDNVGNVGPKTSFTVDIDETNPQISLDYDVTGGSKLTGWEFTFTAIATDDTSGTDYVEFYLNGILQETVHGNGPEYDWIVKLPKGINSTIKAIAYDKAGNYNCDEIIDPEISTHNIPKCVNIFVSKHNNIKIPYLR